MKFTETHPPKRSDHFWLRLVVGLLLGFTLLWAGFSIGSYSWNAWSAYAGYLEYEPLGRRRDLSIASLWACRAGHRRRHEVAVLSLRDRRPT